MVISPIPVQLLFFKIIHRLFVTCVHEHQELTKLNNCCHGIFSHANVIGLLLSLCLYIVLCVHNNIYFLNGFAPINKRWYVCHKKNNLGVHADKTDVDTHEYMHKMIRARKRYGLFLSSIFRLWAKILYNSVDFGCILLRKIVIDRVATLCEPIPL